MKTNVLHIVDKYSYGGVETIIYALIEGYISEKYQLSYYFLRDLKKKQHIEQENVYIKNFSKFSLVRPLFDLIRVIKEDNVSIIHTHHKKGFYLGCIISLLNKKIKFIHHEHGDVLVNGVIYKFALRLISKKISRVVCVSPYVYEKTIKVVGEKNKDKIVALNNFIDVDDSIQMENRPFDKSNLKIGFIGRLSPVKGCKYLISALPFLDNSISYHVYIAGDGVELNPLKALVDKLGLKNKITFEGYVSKISDVYQKIDLVVVPSESESVSLAVLQAWLSSKPVIVSNIKSLDFLAIDYLNVLKFETKNPKSLANKITELCDNQNLQSSLVKRAFDDVKDFSFSKFNANLNFIYDTIK